MPENFQTVSPLDFSHLKESGWDAERSIHSKRGHLKWLHTPLFAMSATKLPTALLKGYYGTSNPICRVG